MEFLSSSEFDYLTFSSYVLLLSPVVWEVQEPCSVLASQIHYVSRWGKDNKLEGKIA